MDELPKVVKRDTRFKKGVSPNPGGRPKNLYTLDRIRSIIARYLDMAPEKLELVVKEKKEPTIDIMVASTMLQCIKFGDFSRLDGMLNRIIGRVKDQIEISTPKPYVIERPNGSQLELGSVLDNVAEE